MAQFYGLPYSEFTFPHKRIQSLGAIPPMAALVRVFVRCRARHVWIRRLAQPLRLGDVSTGIIVLRLVRVLFVPLRVICCVYTILHICSRPLALFSLPTLPPNVLRDVVLFQSVQRPVHTLRRTLGVELGSVDSLQARAAAAEVLSASGSKRKIGSCQHVTDMIQKYTIAVRAD
jgi:hypothetical protein